MQRSGRRLRMRRKDEGAARIENAMDVCEWVPSSTVSSPLSGCLCMLCVFFCYLNSGSKQSCRLSCSWRGLVHHYARATRLRKGSKYLLCATWKLRCFFVGCCCVEFFCVCFDLRYMKPWCLENAIGVTNIRCFLRLKVVTNIACYVQSGRRWCIAAASSLSPRSQTSGTPGAT